jgi:hypothetical protein
LEKLQPGGSRFQAPGWFAPPGGGTVSWLGHYISHAAKRASGLKREGNPDKSGDQQQKPDRDEGEKKLGYEGQTHQPVLCALRRITVTEKGLALVQRMTGCLEKIIDPLPASAFPNASLSGRD